MAGATPLGNMVIKLGLDDADFGKGVANSKKQIKYLGKEMQANSRIADIAGDKASKLGSRYAGLTKIISVQEAQVKALKKAYEDSFVDGKATESTVRLATELQDANSKLANYNLQLQNTSGQLARFQVENEGVTGWLNTHSESWIKQGEKIEKFGEGVSKVGSTFTKTLTVPIVAGATAVTAAAISWESAFAGTKKTVDEVVDANGRVIYSYDELEAGLRNLAKQLPATHAEIAATAENAGQLGIATESVLSFTKTMIDLGESTDMGADQASVALARLANITQMPQENFDRLGATIVELGNNLATTESEITEMALRLAGAGSQVGMSEAQILSFAAALSSVGIQADAGGSAFSKVMIEMQLAVEKGIGSFDNLKATAEAYGLSWDDVVVATAKGGKSLTSIAGQMGMSGSNFKKLYNEANKSAGSLENFAEVAGMSSAEFAKAFQEDASGAIISFIDGLSTAEDRGMSAIKVLDDMEIKEVRLRDSLLRAANASGVFNDALEMGTTAWEENTALTEEAGKRYETTEAKLSMLKNEVVDAAIEFGGPLVDALRDGLEASKPLIEGLGNLAKAFSSLDTEQQQNIVKWGAVAAAAGPTFKVLGGGISVIGKTKKSVGELSKGIVELSAVSAEKKALPILVKSISSAGTAATVATGTGVVGGAGIAGMVATIANLAVPVAIGTAAIGTGIAIWKLWGEEAYNSAKRTETWGVDVGKVTHDTLSTVQENTQQATGQFALMEQGFSGNSDRMVNSVISIGESIEQSLIKKIEGLDKLIQELPTTFDKTMGKMIQEEKDRTEGILEQIQANNERISEIREKASQDNRALNISEAKIIKDLAENTSKAYVETLDLSSEEKKKVLNAMTGDVANASETEAELWLQSLGKQRRAAVEHMSASRKDKENYLKELGYSLDGEFAQKFLKAWDEINKTTVDGFDTQMATIIEKYPELANKVLLATGDVITASDVSADYMKANNDVILKNARELSKGLARSATENAEALSWTADETTKAGKIWNSLELVDKEGKIKTNANEIVTEATKDAATWNRMRMVIHDANLESNARKVIGEASLANGWWDGMDWENKEAVLEDEFSITMFKALREAGKWDEMNLDEKVAFMYSNTPEVMAETMLNLGLWEEFQPQIKDLKADNYDLLNALSFSEEALNEYNALEPSFKELLAKDPATLTIQEATTVLETYNAMTPDFKKLMGNNTDINNIINVADRKLRDYNEIKPGVKHLHATSDTSAVDRMKTEIDSIPNYTEKRIAVIYEGRNTGQTAIHNEKGTNFHSGGDMIVNDQSGPMYQEAVKFPGSNWFVPQGRNVYIPDAPVGTKVLRASLTNIMQKRLVPRYAGGIGIPEDSMFIRNLKSLDSNSGDSVNLNLIDYSNQLEELIFIMSKFGKDLKNLKMYIGEREVSDIVTTAQRRSGISKSRLAGERI